MKAIITIVAFRDDITNSVAYRKFEVTDDPETWVKVIRYYKTMLCKPEVRVISTRKVVF